jgi:AmmeMemoRadiSam system protein B
MHSIGKIPASSMIVRDTAVAGLFYEDDSDQLRQHVTALLEAADAIVECPPQALIVPHAGYVYSGQTAAAAYAQLAPLADVIERVVLFGPTHRVALQGMALPSVDAFATPLGNIPVDQDSIKRAKQLPGICVSDEAHRQEHSLEVQLPFLQTVLGSFSLMPILVGQCAPTAVARVMDTLWGGPNTLLVISTDLSHFHPYEQARQRDALTCERIEAKDNTLNGQDACGAHALNGLMSTEHCRPMTVKLLDTRNSGDTAGGKDRVVGYGAFRLH